MGEPELRGKRYDLVGAALLIIAGFAAFVAVAYLPDLVTAPQGGQAAAGMTMRSAGFAALLGAGYLLVLHRREG